MDTSSAAVEADENQHVGEHGGCPYLAAPVVPDVLFCNKCGWSGVATTDPQRTAYQPPHGPDEPCTCPGCWACTGEVVGCTCDIDWERMYAAQFGRAVGDV